MLKLKKTKILYIQINGGLIFLKLFKNKKIFLFYFANKIKQ